MSLLPHGLRRRLARTRLRVLRAEALTGSGDRASRATGAGIEFADHRPYQPGDDLRYLDRHVYARLGQLHVRQATAYRQLRVRIVIDLSASMAFGTPGKAAMAKRIAAALAYVGLAHGDRVSIGVAADSSVEWSRSAQGIQRFSELLAWLDAHRPRGRSSIADIASSLAASRGEPGLSVVVSDWWSEDVESAVRSLGAADVELVAMQVLSPEEHDPALAGRGAWRMIDAETGDVLDVDLDDATARTYRAELHAWRDELTTLVRRHGGRFVSTRSDAPLAELLLGEWRRQGLLE